MEYILTSETINLYQYGDNDDVRCPIVGNYEYDGNDNILKRLQ